ncbi:MAG: Ig-like domain-containing protein [Gemmatimonadaceae bacterium]|nr:Ig-like domain-containing protein [Gemmatimonadaceae bacterium]
MPSTNVYALALLISVFLCGCSKAGELAEPYRMAVASVSMTPTTTSIPVGQTQQLAALARAADGTALPDRVVTWASTDATIATVSGTGLATAVRPGQTTVMATSEGRSGIAEVTVLAAPSISLQISGLNTYPVRGDTATISWQANDANGCDASGRWSGARPATGTARVLLDTTGSMTWSLRCTGSGGQGTQTVSAVSHIPVAPTSYDNFKSAGWWPTVFPYGAPALAFGDFLGNGTLMLFTAQSVTNSSRPIAEARPGNADWWSLRADSSSQPLTSPNRNWAPTSVSVSVDAPNCIITRKALVADINRDRRPDIVLICHGYDAPPFPGERNLILLSQPNGSYVQRQLGTPVAFGHGGALCDLHRTGGMKLLLTDGTGIRVFDISVEGVATADAASPLSSVTGSYYSVECVDVDGDGYLDVVAGGHEPAVSFGNAPTTVWFGSAARTFTPRVILAVPGEGVVLDFTVTGGGGTRTLWLMRTAGGGGDGAFYQGATLQRIDVASFASSVVVRDRALQGYAWLIPYVRGGVRTLGNPIAGPYWSYSYSP